MLPVSQLNAGFVQPSYPQQVVDSYLQASLVFDLIESRWGFQPILEMLNGYRAGETTPALATTPRDHSATRLATHADPEPVRLLSTPTVRLECPFHVLTSLTAEPPFRSHVQEPRRKRSIAKTVMLPPSVQTVNQGVVSGAHVISVRKLGSCGM